MKIFLTDALDADYWLAGHDTMTEREWTSVRDFSKDGDVIIQRGEYARGSVVAFFDRGNLTTNVAFSSTRKFDTVDEAQLFVLDWERTIPRKGRLTFVIDNGTETPDLRYMHDVVVRPPQLSHIGLSVDIAFQIQGGIITNTTPEPDDVYEYFRPDATSRYLRPAAPADLATWLAANT